ncbi:MAG: helix-turn-helix transcriptional regulator [Bacteroidota bacterium]
MSSPIKNIRFQQRKGSKSFFDLLTLRDILTLKPKDHSQFENHRVTFYVLIFITEGVGTHSINFQNYSYERGTALAIGSDNIHKFYPTEAEGWLLVFTEDFIIQYVSEEHATKIFQLFNEQLVSPKQQLAEAPFTQILTYIEAIQREYQDIKDDFSWEMIRSWLQIIFTQLLRIKSSENEVLGQTQYLGQFLKFQELVESHGQEYKTVAYYAEQLHITPRTLNNITHSIVHKSAKAVISDILITKIKRYLINSDFNVTQIAYEMGFRDASHLFKFFKKNTQLSPKKFQELFK